tara:strand:+ start:1760 stop:2782 length:1023 start_codon:yes stop_codon:yes gene_type:complete
MSRHQTRKALKHDIHAGASAGSSGGIPFGNKTYKRIVPDKDCCINRENPNRMLPSSSALVVGFDPLGTFKGVIPSGATHGYWELAPPTTLGADYIARTLLEFDLDDAGITTGDLLETCILELTYYSSNTITPDAGYTLDFYRFHPGLTFSGGSGGPITGAKVFTENATWWEYDYTGTAITGTTSNAAFTATLGVSHGTTGTRWEYQGLGVTGTTAEHIGVIYLPKPSEWVDFSGGVGGSNIDSSSDNIYSYGLNVTRETVLAGQQVVLDITSAAKDALANYNNKLRIMIKLRDDHAYDGTSNSAFVSFYSTEAEPTPDSISSITKAKYSPAIHLTYWDKF